jgi:hypothetical protein
MGSAQVQSASGGGVSPGLDTYGVGKRLIENSSIQEVQTQYLLLGIVGFLFRLRF